MRKREPTVLVRIRESDRKLVEKLAHKNDIPIPDVLRLVIKHYLAKHKGKR